MTDELNTTPPPPPPENGAGKKGTDGTSGSSSDEPVAADTSEVTDGAAQVSSATETSGEAPPPAPPPPDMPGPPPPSGSGGAPPPPPSAAVGGGDGSGNGNRTLMLVLSYLGPLAAIPFFAAQDDPEVHWHSKNGLVLFAAEVALWFVLFAFSMTGILSCLTCFAGLGLSVGLFAVHVWCIFTALNGKRPMIPGLSQLADSF